MTQITQQLTDAWNQLLTSVVQWTPRVVVGLVLVVVAIVTAKIIARLLRSFLRRIDLDALLGRIGARDALSRLGVSQSLNDVLPRIVYYLLLILFARTGADAMGLTAISSAIGTFMAYLPNVFAAVLIVLLGSAAAGAASNIVSRGAANSGIEFAGSLGTLVGALVMTVVAIMAIAQLRVDTEIVRLVVAGMLAGLALALGLSFGLGSRDITRNILAGFYARKTFDIGADVEVGGESGTLAAITPTQTLLERDGQVIAIANSAFLESVARQHAAAE